MRNHLLEVYSSPMTSAWRETVTPIRLSARCAIISRSIENWILASNSRLCPRENYFSRVFSKKMRELNLSRPIEIVPIRSPQSNRWDNLFNASFFIWTQNVTLEGMTLWGKPFCKVSWQVHLSDTPYAHSTILLHRCRILLAMWDDALLTLQQYQNLSKH